MSKEIRVQAKRVSSEVGYNNSVSVEIEIDPYYFDEVLEDFTADEINNNIGDSKREELYELLRMDFEDVIGD
jgi:hypothetical protein